MSLEERIASMDRRLSQILSGIIVDPHLTKYLARPKNPYFYRTQFLPLTASLTLTAEFTIESGYDFLCLGANAVVTDTSDAVIASVASTFVPFNPPFLVTIRNSGSSQQLMSNGIAFANIFGTGADPYYWPIPKVFTARTVVQTTLENLSATDRRVRIAYFGFHTDIPS